MESKQRLVSSIEYYNDRLILNILYLYIIMHILDNSMLLRFSQTHKNPLDPSINSQLSRDITRYPSLIIIIPLVL